MCALTYVWPWVSYPRSSLLGVGEYNCLSAVIVDINLEGRPLSQKLSLVYCYTGRRLYVLIVLDSGITITIRVPLLTGGETEHVCGRMSLL